MSERDLETRGREWRHSVFRTVCDELEPWEHGTIARLSAHPTYRQYNAVIVEGRPGLSAEELVAVAEDALGHLKHRRVDFEIADEAEGLRTDFEAAGWRTNRLVWMLHDEGAPSAPKIDVIEVPYDDVYDLRLLWHGDDPEDTDPTAFLSIAREVSMQRCARVFAHFDAGEPVGYAQLEGCDPAAAEVIEVFERPERRGQGIGTELTKAAIAAAEEVDDLWICADYDGAPRRLYARLGFRPALATMEVTKT